MNFPWELLVLLLLILLNGFFAMSELAVISSRRARLKALAEGGSKAARSALDLSESPGPFLSTVQIGITMIGIFAGAYGEKTLTTSLSGWLAQFSWLESISGILALAIVVAGITYFSLILGELVPKHIALANAERIASMVAPPMKLLATLFTPMVVVLDASTRFVLRLLGRHAVSAHKISDEEIRSLISEAADTGVVERAEGDMIRGVMRLADRPIEALMTPRVDIVWLDVDAAEQNIRQLLRDSYYSRFLVSRGDLDEVMGVVQVRDLFERMLDERTLDVREVLRQPLFVHENTSALNALEQLRGAEVQMAIVVDEYGSIQGLVTSTDILTAIAGEIAENTEKGESLMVHRDDGSWLLDGGLPVDEVRDLLGLPSVPQDVPFHTLAGLMLHQFGHVPSAGEYFVLDDYRFEVVDMDGHRVDKVLVAPIGAPVETDIATSG
ncbi:MAG: HlyC/CorC family transporter [Gammaproteobacteria bacterium]|nr:HlyC/CorC family transporter [Gammaproteobacteria bacterium]